MTIQDQIEAYSKEIRALEAQKMAIPRSERWAREMVERKISPLQGEINNLQWRLSKMDVD